MLTWLPEDIIYAEKHSRILYDNEKLVNSTTQNRAFKSSPMSYNSVSVQRYSSCREKSNIKHTKISRCQICGLPLKRRICTMCYRGCRADKPQVTQKVQTQYTAKTASTLRERWSKNHVQWWEQKQGNTTGESMGKARAVPIYSYKILVHTPPQQFPPIYRGEILKSTPSGEQDGGEQNNIT